MKSDKLLVVVFGLTGLTFGLVLVLLSMIDGPDNSILVVGADQQKMHVWVLGQHVYSREIGGLDELASHTEMARHLIWAVVVLSTSLLGLGAGYLVSREAHRTGCVDASRSAPKTPRRG